MQIPRQATLLRIFIGEDDAWEGRPLYEAIVLKARETQLPRQGRQRERRGLDDLIQAAAGHSPRRPAPGAAGRR